MRRNVALTKKYDTFVFDWDGTLNRMGTVLKLKNLAKKLLMIYGRASKSARSDGGLVDIKGRSLFSRHKYHLVSLF